ncbi:citron Rho-interacting kinase-like [Limulus polyphemus]|uniref:non-specific serine/threonine protein kinase n=1 Tax=Limulus polyphemus TaxID=6850 RepID=A0ABM1T0C4_LIMPO|nr:citron Rho-interacting kinase-like [Limulus polyphemus]
MEKPTETIASRSTKLNQLILRRSNLCIPHCHLMNREVLLDAFVTLYDICNNEQMRKDKQISSFVEKFRENIQELRLLRVNVADFEMKKIIGRGHFGEVQVVREKQTGDVYAMKVLSKAEILSQQNIAFYEEERDIMVKAASSWITRLQYAFQDHLNLYLVMEFHPGGDLLSLLDCHDSLLPESMAKFYLTELVLAIYSLHTMGYVHRDIKPDNILIDRTGHIKLADFGSAAKLNEHNTVTSRMPVGTPDYIAPEVLLAMNGGPSGNTVYGTECDWWSLGIVAYEMLFGTTPFTDDKVVVTYSNIMNFKKSLTFPDEPEISAQAIDLIKKLLQEASLRLGYNQIYEHEFFVDVDWNNMFQTVPPFVPHVSSQDDTSNFDEFEHEVSRPSTVGLRNKKEFTGENLPFIGFTYTNHLTSQSERISGLEGSFYSHGKFVITEDSKELQLLQQKVCFLESKELEHQEETKLLTLKLQEKEKLCQDLKEERDSLQKDVVQLEFEIESVKRLLEVQRLDRTITENKAMELMKGFKEKSKLQENLMEEIKKALEEEKNKNRNLEDKLCCCQEEMKGKILEIKEIQLETGQLKEQIKMVDTNKQDLEKDFAAVQETLEGFQEKLELERKARAEAQEQIVGLKNVIVHLESDWTTKEGLMQQLGQGEGAAVVLTAEVTNLDPGEEEMEKLQNELEEEKNLKSKLELQISQLENELKTAKNGNEKKNKEWRFKEKKFYKRIQKLEEELQYSKSMKFKLEKDLQNMERKENELNSIVIKLQKSVTSLEESVEKLESQKDHFDKIAPSTQSQAVECPKPNSSDLKQENAFLTTKIKQMTSQLELLHETVVKERACQIELREQLKEKEDELSEIKKAIQISQCEAEQAEGIASTLHDSNHQLCEKSTILEKEKSKWEELRKSYKEKITELETNLQNKQETLDEHQNANELLKDEVNIKEREKERAVKECNDTKQELVEEKKKIKTLEVNISLLKLTCTSLEDQLKDYDVVTDTQEEKIAQLEKEKATIKKDIQSFEEEVKNMELLVSRERKARLESEHKLLDLEEEGEISQAIQEEKLNTVQEKLTYQQKINTHLTEQLLQLERQLATQSQSLRQLLQKVTSLEEDNIQVKEEAAKHITQLSSLKTSNLKLTQSLEKALEKGDRSKEQIEELYNTQEATEVSHAHEKVKLQETIAQQTKLIDFLQTKVEGLEKKKKCFFGIRFKEVGSSTNPVYWREFKGAYDREKSKCRRLQEQLEKSRAEVMACRTDIVRISKNCGEVQNTNLLSRTPTSPKSHAVLSTLAHSSGSNMNNSTDNLSTFITKESASVFEKPQGQCLSHNVPHQFQEILTMRGTKCAACLDSIHFGRNASRCYECGMICHIKCSTSLPSTCTLPFGCIQHFIDSLDKNGNKSQNQPSTKVIFAEDISIKTVNPIQGWVKISRNGKQGWEKHYLWLENTTLYFFDKENVQDASASDSIDLCPIDGEVLVTSAVSATELIGTAKTDLHYILKLEYFPNTSFRPPRCLYIMVQSFSEKQMWVSAMESVLKKNEMTKDDKLLENSILHLEGENILDINITCHLNDNLLLVGAMEGLYVVDVLAEPSYSLQKKIDHIPSVYQISVLKTLNTVLLISGEERTLRMLELPTLNRWIKGDKITVTEEMTALQPVSDIEACHLFGTSEDATSLCAAASTTVFLLRWNVDLHTFCLWKEVITAEPCSCMHLTRNSVIFGADKFFKVDLKDHSVEEFLDVSDSSLAFLVYGASQLCSFPVAIFQATSDEYLLCFHELGVFVDCYGRRTRERDMKWTRLPLAFAYRAPYLFVTHFNSVEAVEIIPQQSTKEGARTLFEVASPHYLGPGMFIGSVYISSFHDNQMEILSIQGKLAAVCEQDITATLESNLSDTSSSSEESTGTEFSSPPSVMQSLETNLSELTEASSSTSIN